ncbi:hypothetical protein RvY_05694 [Ramazzottius varieornatus]|uniref:RanBD1 domain-containing protein n=1 Tax=Ramazzottius varieornatus TaxID=947166 RepID=A0A1D1V1I5_RAMVA|nr:hypothetical protein RvY_05694 [Ramazzottius varieornatus]
MSRVNEMILRFVDYDDYGDTSKESVTGFFQSIGVLNAAFQKRINQLTSIHPCVPLGATLQEYIKHQQDLEDKYGVFIEQRTVRLPDRQHTIHPDASSQSQASSAPVKSSAVTSGSETPPATTNSSKFTGFNMDAFKSSKSSSSADVSPPPSDPPVSSKKRRAEDDDGRSRKTVTEPESMSSQKGDKEEVSKGLSSGRSLTQNASGFFSVKPRPSSSSSTQGDSDKSGEEPKESVFAGFGGLSQNSSSADKPAAPALNFGSLFGSGGSSFPSTSTSNSTSTSKDSLSTAPAFPSFFGSLNKDSSETNKDTNSTESTNKTGFTGFAGFSSVAGSSSGFSLGGFKFGEMSKVPTANAAAEDEDNDDEGGVDKDEVDVVPVVPVEDQEVAEPDALVSKKCRVLYLDDGAWKTRGTGTAHLKSIDDNAVQLIVRAATSLGAVLLNARVGKDTRITRNSRKGKGSNSESVDIFCLPNPVFKGVKEDKPYQFVLKFKDEKEANEFYGVVESVRK